MREEEYFTNGKNSTNQEISDKNSSRSVQITHPDNTIEKQRMCVGGANVITCKDIQSPSSRGR